MSEAEELFAWRTSNGAEFQMLFPKTHEIQEDSFGPNYQFPFRFSELMAIGYIGRVGDGTPKADTHLLRRLEMLVSETPHFQVRGVKDQTLFKPLPKPLTLAMIIAANFDEDDGVCVSA